MLPLTLMACTSNEPPPKPAASGTKTTPAPPAADDGKVEPPPPPSEPAYGVPVTDEPPLDVIDPEPAPTRPADKYGAPPAMDRPDGPQPLEDVTITEPEIEERRPTKYGAPPRRKPSIEDPSKGPL